MRFNVDRLPRLALPLSIAALVTVVLTTEFGFGRLWAVPAGLWVAVQVQNRMNQIEAGDPAFWTALLAAVLVTAALIATAADNSDATLNSSAAEEPASDDPLMGTVFADHEVGS